MDAQQWDDRYTAAQPLWGRKPNRFLVEQAGALTPGTALDVACGDGRNALWLAERGWTVTGVDFSEAAIARAREEAARRQLVVDFVVGDVTTWAAAQPRDLVVVLYLHLPADQRRSALRLAASAVAAHGRMVVVGHDVANLEHGVGGPPDPAVLYTAADVQADLDSTGMRILTAEQVQRPVEGSGTALDCLVVALRS